MTKKQTILVLEDDRMLRDVMVDGLTDSGYGVIPVTDPDQLTAELEARDGQAILVADRDIGEGASNGFDVAAAALDRYSGLRVVYVSGTHIAVKHRVLSPRERSLLKPFAVSQLLALLKQLG